jgi:hypothetical protein
MEQGEAVDGSGRQDKGQADPFADTHPSRFIEDGSQSVSQPCPWIADRTEGRWLSMSLASWLSRTRSPEHARRAQRCNPVSRQKRARLFVEQLDARTLLSGYTAYTVSDLINDIKAADKAGGANTITLAAATTSPYVLTAALPVMAVNDDLTIVGDGDTIERSTASGTPDFRLFTVVSEAALSLQDLTLQNGLVLGEVAEGGGILNSGALVLSAVSVLDDTALGVAGAAGRAEVGGSASGGAIWSDGSLTLENNTLLEGNIACGGTGGYVLGGLEQQKTGSAGGNGFGGGLYVAGGTASITATTFARNRAEGGAGGSPAANSGRGYGGALYAAAGQVVLTTSIVNDNVARYLGQEGGASGGGGLYIASATVDLDSFTVANTIDNTPNNIEGTYTLQGS